MRKLFISATLAVATIVLAACGMGGTSKQTTADVASSVISAAVLGNGASAGSTAGGILTSVLTGEGTNVLGTVLGSLLGNKTSANSIVGTWTYAQPKVVFESENILAKLGSSVASSKLESTLTAQLKKMGFNSGKSTLVLNSDKTCQFNLSGKTLNGTYSYNSSSSLLTIQGALGMTSVTCTCNVVNGQMYMLFDADKLLGIASSVANASSTTSSLSSLLSNYSGLKLGWAMNK